MLTQLLAEDLRVDKPVEWPVYSSSGRLLLQPGQSFQSEGLVEALLWRGLFRGNAATFGSGEYEKIVDIEHEIYGDDRLKKAGQNYNDEFSALANRILNKHGFNEILESELLLPVISGEHDLEIESVPVAASAASILMEDMKQELLASIKDDVISLVRSELENFFKDNVNQQIQNEMNTSVYQDMQQNVITTLGIEIDGKIKKEVNHFIEHEYKREKENPINRNKQPTGINLFRFRRVFP
jgi:hypothetical protein